jgi:hypothetical protein
MAEIEGKDYTSKDKLSDAFKALLADTSKKEKQYSDSYFASSYFTSIKSLLTKLLVPYIAVPYAKTLVNNLNNVVGSRALSEGT